MEDKNISGDSLLELIKENRKLFHENAHSTPGKYVPNAILIHPGYYDVLKEPIKTGNDSNEKKVIFDLEIFVTEDVSSFKLIKIYVPDECSI
jgi:hypothetical protein